MYPAAILSLVAAMLGIGPAAAQVAAAPAAASAPIDRAQHDADKVFRMILMHADKPRRAVREDKPAAATPAAVTRAAVGSTARPAAEMAKSGGAAAAAAAAPAQSAGTPDSAMVAVAAPTVPAMAASTPSAAAVPSGRPLATKNDKLELVESVEPEFPSRLIRSLGSGSVVVQFDVQPDGSVVRPEVVRSSHRGLNAAAQAAVAAWRFKPISATTPGVVELKFE